MDDMPAPVMDNITDIHVHEEIEELEEVIEVEDEDEDVEFEGIADPQLYASVLSDSEKRKMDKVQVQACKEVEKERKKAEREAAKALKEKEKEERKKERAMTSSPSIEMSLAGKGLE